MGRDGMKALSIHLTDMCNNRCIFCVVDAPSQRGDSVRRDLIEHFLFENREAGYEAVNLHGGEPTMRPDFLDILSRIQQLGYPTIFLQTNARRLSNFEFARQVVDRGVSLFIVSMHGKDAAVQDAISQSPKSFDQAVAGIRNVKKLGQKVRTNTVVCKQNLESLPDIVSFVINLGADHVNISAMHPAGMAYKNFAHVTPAYTEIKPYLFEAVDRAVAAGQVITLEGFPYCTIPGYETYMIDWSTQRYKMLFRTFIMDDYESYMDACARTKQAKCSACAYSKVCGGVYKEYIQFIGWDEFHPVTPVHADGEELTSNQVRRTGADETHNPCG